MFEQPEYTDETFTSLECRELPITGKEFNGCTFANVQFAGTKFVRCRFIDCTFQNSNLSSISFKGSVLRDAVFEDSKLLGINWTELVTASHLKFHRCVLSMGIFSGMDLRKWVLDNCIARELDLEKVNLSEADCRETDFSGSRFFQTNLTKADLRHATNYAISPADNILKKARFSMPEAMGLLYGLDIILE